MIDILAEHGTIFTMNSQRQIIQDGTIAVDHGKILEVDDGAKLAGKYEARETIDASRKAVLPGFIDTHGHAGENLIKTVAEHAHLQWIPIADHILLRSTTEDMWYADGLLTSIERIKFGITCGISMLGGNSPRVDDPIFARRHAEAIREVGIRDIIGVGPPPFLEPILFSRWTKGVRTDQKVTFEECLETTEKIIQEWHGKEDGRIQVWLSPINTYRVTHSLAKEYGYETDGVITKSDVPKLIEQARRIRQLADKYKIGIHSHAIGGEVKFAHDKLKILGPSVVLAHCNGLTKDEIRILARTGTKVAHCPNARRIIGGRCPVPELINAGVTVAIATDGASPDRTFDLFEDMRLAMKLQRMHFQSAAYMPPGKLLEMVTIDAAKAFGMDKVVGSLEPGKKADLILVDLFKPHLVPYFMVPQRLVYEASGHDVDTVIIDGKIVMRNRKMLTVNETEALELAQREAEHLIEVSGVKPLMGLPKNFWGHTKY